MDLDVAIMGGGLAGAALARQIRRQLPALSVGLFERSDDGGFKVGESTVEIASNYFVRKLGLGNYLYQNHLPKNGLRFFFDDAQRSTELWRMGELGSDSLPFHPSFQVDRQRLDADLRGMNVAAGVHVRVGVRVRDVQVGTGGARHRFTIEHEGGSETVSCRWLVDASGRARLLGRALGESRRETGHELAAAWGRFTNVVDMDDYGPPEFRARVRHTSRFLSTTHLMYPGYWIWFIPIARGVTSVGVVIEKRLFRDEMRSVPGLLAFCNEHRAARDLLAGATGLDAMGYGHVPYGGDRFFSSDRWARVGEAGAFTDPLYSPGSDFIAMENDYTTQLIASEVGGEAGPAFAERCELYDAFIQFRFQQTLLLYRDLYPTLGSFDLFRIKWDFDIHHYYNLWYDAYAQDRHLDLAWLREQLAMRDPILVSLGNFSRLFREAADELRRRGTYFDRNLDRWGYGLSAVDFVQEVGRQRPRKQVLRAVSAISNECRARVIRLLEGDDREIEPMPLGAFMVERDLRKAE